MGAWVSIQTRLKRIQYPEDKIRDTISKNIVTVSSHVQAGHVMTLLTGTLRNTFVCGDHLIFAWKVIITGVHSENMSWTNFEI